MVVGGRTVAVDEMQAQMQMQTAMQQGGEMQDQYGHGHNVYNQIQRVLGDSKHPLA